MAFKSKILILGITAVFAGFLFYPSLSSGWSLSADIFPLNLGGISLTLAEEESSDDEIAEGFSAYYEGEEEEIDVFFWRMRNVSIAKSIEQDLIPRIKTEYALLFNKIDWENSQTVSVSNYEATAVRFRAYLGGDYLDGGLVFAAVKDYFILIQIFGYGEKPSFLKLERVLEIFINKIPGVIEKIHEDQNSYKEEFVEAYEMMAGGITQVFIKDAKLDIRLEVQGNTAGKIPKVSEGDEIEVRLEIENDSNQKIDLKAKLVYSDFDLEEKKYTICLEEKKDITCFIGSSKTEPEFIEVPQNSKLYIYSKQVPKQTGYLDVQAIVYYDEDKEAKISNFILVEERPCNWRPICL